MTVMDHIGLSVIWNFNCLNFQWLNDDATANRHICRNNQHEI